VTDGGTRRFAATMELRPDPEAASDACRLAAEVVGHLDHECQRATTLVVTELAENIIKYGACAADERAGTIFIGVDDDVVRVRARNAVQSEADARRVVEAIERLSIAEDVSELYRQRLRELFDSPELPRAQLGLLRAAFEGSFRLSCSYEASILEIVAERRGGSVR
jgi:hypothetical protein